MRLFAFLAAHTPYSRPPAPPSIGQRTRAQISDLLDEVRSRRGALLERRARIDDELKDLERQEHVLASAHARLSDNKRETARILAIAVGD